MTLIRQPDLSKVDTRAGIFFLLFAAAIPATVFAAIYVPEYFTKPVR
jgi:hypothetical protein